MSHQGHLLPSRSPTGAWQRGTGALISGLVYHSAGAHSLGADRQSPLRYPKQLYITQLYPYQERKKNDI